MATELARYCQLCGAAAFPTAALRQVNADADRIRCPACGLPYRRAAALMVPIAAHDPDTDLSLPELLAARIRFRRVRRSARRSGRRAADPPG